MANDLSGWHWNLTLDLVWVETWKSYYIKKPLIHHCADVLKEGAEVAELELVAALGAVGGHGGAVTPT